MIRTSDGSIGSATVTFAQEMVSDLTTGVHNKNSNCMTALWSDRTTNMGTDQAWWKGEPAVESCCPAICTHIDKVIKGSGCGTIYWSHLCSTM